MHRYHLVKAEADDHMTDKTPSGLVPLKSWFSLDLAAHQNESKADEEVEADNLSGDIPRAILPSRLPRLWSSHSDTRRENSAAYAARSDHEASTSPAESNPVHLRCGVFHSARPLAESWTHQLTQGLS